MMSDDKDLKRLCPVKVSETFRVMGMKARPGTFIRMRSEKLEACALGVCYAEKHPAEIRQLTLNGEIDGARVLEWAQSQGYDRHYTSGIMNGFDMRTPANLLRSVGERAQKSYEAGIVDGWTIRAMMGLLLDHVSMNVNLRKEWERIQREVVGSGESEE